jgi:hypothetical protein
MYTINILILYPWTWSVLSYFWVTCTTRSDRKTKSSYGQDSLDRSEQFTVRAGNCPGFGRQICPFSPYSPYAVILILRTNSRVTIFVFVVMSRKLFCRNIHRGASATTKDDDFNLIIRILKPKNSASGFYPTEQNKCIYSSLITSWSPQGMRVLRQCKVTRAE